MASAASGDTASRRPAAQLLRSVSGTARPNKPIWWRTDSQLVFAQQGQTIIVLDWDDTLFPTTYVQEDLKLNWWQPLHGQDEMDLGKLKEIEQKLSQCEQRALEVLRRASELAHVVVVTLASSGWVDLACRHFFPSMGAFMCEKQTPVVYAQELVAPVDAGGAARCQSAEELERYWGLIKGRAISEQVDKFYPQYEGQSWKNVLSIGDSSFERYGLLAATSAYMQGRRLTNEDGPVWHPAEEGCWLKVQDGKVKKLRAKCCKLLDQPDVDELTTELEMLAGWLEDMVRLDTGFDLDLEVLEGEAQLGVIEAVLRGEVPASALPSKRRPATVSAEAVGGKGKLP